ncbi:MAG: hypothetical protein ABIP79_00335 [Chitinophagaceae bacterium]
MKATAYSILININKADGFECIGKFFIGNNKKFAHSLFDQLKGNTDVNEHSMLTIELMETLNELPLNLNIISCSLDELAANCRTITKETFKAINLEELL